MSDWPYPAPPDDGAAAHLVAGMRLPDILLPATLGGQVSLARVVQRAVVFVYPWTGRPGVANPPGWDDIAGAHGSTPEAQGFQSLHFEFEARNVQVFGLSSQASAWQLELAQRLGLCFPLLSDDQFEVADALRLPRFEAGDVTYLKRLTLMCVEGCIVRTFYPVHPPDRHAADLLASL